MSPETFAAVPSESALIGAILKDPAAVLPLCDAAGLSAESFTDADARAAFAAVAALQAEGNPVDLAAVAQELAGDAVSVETLARFMDDCSTVTHAAYHAGKVREAERKAGLAAALRDTLQALHEGGSAADAVAKVQAAGEAAEAQGARPRIVSAADFAAVNRPEPPQVIRGVLRAGQIGFLSAASKAGKTWAMLAAGFAVSSGARWFGWETTPGRVLYVNGELTPFDLEQRLKMLAGAMELPGIPAGLDVWDLYGESLGIPALLNEVLRRQRVRGEPYSLVIPDPLYRFNQGRDENDNAVQSVTMGELGTLANRSGAAALVAHHFSKGNQAGKDHMDRGSGAGMFNRAPATIMTLTAHDEPGCFTLETTCRSFAQPAKAVVRWEYPLWRMDDTLDPEKIKQHAGAKRAPKYTPEKIVEVLPDGKVTHGDWFKAAQAVTGISKTRFNELVKIAKARQLVFAGFGGYTRTGGETP